MSSRSTTSLQGFVHRAARPHAGAVNASGTERPHAAATVHGRLGFYGTYQVITLRSSAIGGVPTSVLDAIGEK